MVPGSGAVLTAVIACIPGVVFVWKWGLEVAGAVATTLPLLAAARRKIASGAEGEMAKVKAGKTST